ncbi:MAG: CHAT domain-containing protein [Lewinellaceae bacterium]|nr:CHAT domain-containing protein [Lewinellaceae bacterium]
MLPDLRLFPWGKLLLYLLLLHSCSPVAGQRTPRYPGFEKDSIQAVTYFNIADTSYMDVDKCIRYSHRAIPLLKKTGQWEKYVYVLTGLSYCYGIKEQYDSIETNNILAYQEARRYLTPDKAPYMASLNNLAIVYTDYKLDYDRALDYYQEALMSFDSARSLLSFKATILKNIGRVYLKKGDFIRSEIYFNEAYTSYLQAFHDPVYADKEDILSFRIAEVFQDLAMVNQYQQKFRTAEKYLLDMLELMQTNKKAFNNRYYVYCYTNLAEVELKMDAGRQARTYLQRALQLKPLTTSQVSAVYRILSRVDAADGHLENALKAAQKAVAAAPAEIPIDRSQAHLTLAEAWFNLQEYDCALEAADEAISHLIPVGRLSADTPELPENFRPLSRIDLVNALQLKAACLEAVYGVRHDIALLIPALNCYFQISRLSDQLRQDYQSEESKAFLSESTHSYYEKGIAVAAQLHILQPEGRHIQEIFYFFEKSKAVVLLEEIRAKEAEGIFTLPREWIDQEYAIRVELNYLRRLLDAENRRSVKNQTSIKTWNSRLLELMREKDDLIARIGRNYPDYTAYTRTEIPDIGSVQQALTDDNRAILEFFAGQENCYALFIRRHSAELRKIGPPDSLRFLTNQVAENLRMDDLEGIRRFQQAAYRLYRQLFESFDLEAIENLTIIPDGFLNLLPFELLLTRLPQDQSPRRYPYLLNDCTTGYAYSAALLSIQQQSPQSGGRVLVVAPVFEDDPARYLPNSELPITALEQFDCTVLSKREANIPGFLNQAADYGLIYFSTHAQTSDSLNNQPSIDFADGQLYLSDLYTLHLPAHLAVLSACQTGLGDLRKGEGVMSLARGFTYAGVPSVVTSLWKVNENATHSIMQDFYRRLADGLQKDEALRQAKLDYLKKCPDIKAAPYFWSGFIVIGNTHTFRFEKRGRSGKVRSAFLISAIVLILVFVFQFSTKKYT